MPFADRPHIVTVQVEPVDVYRNQIIVWIKIDDVLRPLPAILDTGHGHSASIGKGQLRRWSGASLKRIGELEVGHQWVLPVFARTIHGRGDCKASRRKSTHVAIVSCRARPHSAHSATW
jgi:hypothetical protein